ncbi:hypothetical protein VTL71DRAFT_13629, partial [Oculimacula yallundae]
MKAAYTSLLIAKNGLAITKEIIKRGWKANILGYKFVRNLIQITRRYHSVYSRHRRNVTGRQINSRKTLPGLSPGSLMPSSALKIASVNSEPSRSRKYVGFRTRILPSSRKRLHVHVSAISIKENCLH